MNIHLGGIVEKCIKFADGVLVVGGDRIRLVTWQGEVEVSVGEIKEIKVTGWLKVEECRWSPLTCE